MSYADALIEMFYADKVAKRSGVPLINHINEGYHILDRLAAPQIAKDAYCLHPMFQNDDDLIMNYPLVDIIPPKTMFLVMEYRNIANAGLREKIVDKDGNILKKIQLSVIPEVNLMLTADKIQNKKDFMKYHYGKHEDSLALEVYFDYWLQTLGVDQHKYLYLTVGLE